MTIDKKSRQMPKRANWAEEDLKRRRNSDSRKARKTTELRRVSFVIASWFARRSTMVHWRKATNSVRMAQQWTAFMVRQNIPLVIFDLFSDAISADAKAMSNAISQGDTPWADLDAFAAAIRIGGETESWALVAFGLLSEAQDAYAAALF